MIFKCSMSVILAASQAPESDAEYDTIQMAERIPIIAITTRSSTKEKPLGRRVLEICNMRVLVRSFAVRFG